MTTGKPNAHIILSALVEEWQAARAALPGALYVMLLPPPANQTEAALIRDAVVRYRQVIVERGDDPRNYGPAIPGVFAEFGWGEVECLAGGAVPNARAYAPDRICEAVKTALEHQATVARDPAEAELARTLATRINTAVEHERLRAAEGRADRP